MSDTPRIARIERRSAPLGLSDRARGARLRLFFGGSFDPPHLGHALIPFQAAIELDPDARLVFVPAARSPLKPIEPAPTEDRLRMLETGLAGRSGWEIWEQELADSALNPDAPSYWADTWAIVRAMGLRGENRFLIGADQALSMHRWRRFGEFWRDAIVALRDDSSSTERLLGRLAGLGVWTSRELTHWGSSIVQTPMIDASSTAIRAALADPQRRENPIIGLDDRVHAYILENGLYTLA